MAKSATSKASAKKLTSAQKEALKKLKSFIKSKSSFFRLSGYAGTGKSWLICHFIKWLRQQNLEFVAAAPTNKAAKNLMQVAMSMDINLEVKTIAQLLGQQPEINEETGVEEFTSMTEAEFDDYEVIGYYP